MLRQKLLFWRLRLRQKCLNYLNAVLRRLLLAGLMLVQGVRIPQELVGVLLHHLGFYQLSLGQIARKD